MLNKHYYTRYKKFIAYCRIRKLKAEYTEIHHIKPKCLNGTNDENNLIKLTAREHYIAHVLLWKIYPNSEGLSLAVVSFRGREKAFINSRQIELARKNKAKLTSIRQIGQRHTLEARRKISEKAMGREVSLEVRKGRSKRMKTNMNPTKGRKRTLEERLKISKNRKDTGIKPPYLENPIVLSQAALDSIRRIELWLRAEELLELWTELGYPGPNIFAEYAKETRLSVTTIHIRFKKGWDPKRDPNYQKWKLGIST